MNDKNRSETTSLQAREINKMKLIDIINAILSPVRPIRDDAAHAMYVSGFSPTLIRDLRWGDILELKPEGVCMIRTPGVRAIQMHQQVASSLLAWSILASENAWLHEALRVFPHITNSGCLKPGERLTEAELRIIGYHPTGFIPPHSAKDIRDVAALLLAWNLEGSHDEVLELRWGDIDESFLGNGAVSENPRLDLETNLTEWQRVWPEVVGRNSTVDDLIIVPSQAGRIRWEEAAPNASNQPRPKPLTRSGLSSLLRARIEAAGYPALANDLNSFFGPPTST